MQSSGSEAENTSDTPSGNDVPGVTESERAIITERQKVVLQAIKNVLKSQTLEDAPTIAVLGSGGGLRAMISLLGTLQALNEEGLLDCVTYLCGVSGSTWCMSFIYEIQDWTNFDDMVQKIKKQITTDTLSLDDIANYLENTALEDTFSMTDLWAVFVAYFMTHQINTNKLSEHRKGIEDGKKPYPIYTAVPVTITDNTSKNNWIEFTPDHVGFTELKNSFIKTEDFGSEFEYGENIVQKTEPNLCYLDGLWGSAVADGIPYWKEVINILESLLTGHTDTVESLLTGHTDILKTLITEFSGVLKKIFTDVSDKLRSTIEGCPVLKDTGVVLKIITQIIAEFKSYNWGTTNNFLYNYSDSSDSGIPDYISKFKFLHLKDPGLLLNTAYPVVLCEERTADLILSFDFSGGDPFQTIIDAKTYCDKNSILFPDIKKARTAYRKNPKDCYIFKDNDGKKKPTVMHFPLFNKVNCKGPDGVLKYSIEFNTANYKYTDDSFSKLIDAAKANVKNNIELIKEQMENLVKGNGK